MGDWTILHMSYVYVCARVCVCVCVYIYVYTHVSLFILAGVSVLKSILTSVVRLFSCEHAIFLFMCTCVRVCVCVCVWLCMSALSMSLVTSPPPALLLTWTLIKTVVQSLGTKLEEEPHEILNRAAPPCPHHPTPISTLPTQPCAVSVATLSSPLSPSRSQSRRQPVTAFPTATPYWCPSLQNQLSFLPSTL